MRIVCPRPFSLMEIIKFSNLDVNRSKQAEIKRCTKRFQSKGFTLIS